MSLPQSKPLTVTLMADERRLEQISELIRDESCMSKVSQQSTVLRPAALLNIRYISIFGLIQL